MVVQPQRHGNSRRRYRCRHASRVPPAFASLDPNAPITAIAVLPLAHLAEGDDLFARQLHEEIITQLSRLTSLRVVSRTSVERYRTTDKLLPQIAAELGVQAVVTGSVAMTGESDSVRISVQLLHAPSDTHMESFTWQREMRDILRLQTEIAVEIATGVQGELGVEEVPAPDQIAQVDPEAHRLSCAGATNLTELRRRGWRRRWPGSTRRWRTIRHSRARGRGARVPGWRLCRGVTRSLRT